MPEYTFDMSNTEASALLTHLQGLSMQLSASELESSRAEGGFLNDISKHLAAQQKAYELSETMAYDAGAHLGQSENPNYRFYDAMRIAAETIGTEQTYGEDLPIEGNFDVQVTHSANVLIYEKNPGEGADPLLYDQGFETADLGNGETDQYRDHLSESQKAEIISAVASVELGANKPQLKAAIGAYRSAVGLEGRSIEALIDKPAGNEKGLQEYAAFAQGVADLKRQYPDDSRERVDRNLQTLKDMNDRLSGGGAKQRMQGALNTLKEANAMEKQEVTNLDFYSRALQASQEHGELNHGVSRLELDRDLAISSEAGEVIISRPDGEGSEVIFYEQSGATAHLSGEGETYRDFLTSSEKSSILTEISEIEASRGTEALFDRADQIMDKPLYKDDAEAETPEWTQEEIDALDYNLSEAPDAGEAYKDLNFPHPDPEIEATRLVELTAQQRVNRATYVELEAQGAQDAQEAYEAERPLEETLRAAGYSRSPEALEALLDAKGIHPVATDYPSTEPYHGELAPDPVLEVQPAIESTELTQQRHSANQKFYTAVEGAVLGLGKSDGYGVHELKLPDEVSIVASDGEVSIVLDGGEGSKSVVYQKTRETAHLSGSGVDHIDRLSGDRKSGVLHGINEVAQAHIKAHPKGPTTQRLMTQQLGKTATQQLKAQQPGKSTGDSSGMDR